LHHSVLSKDGRSVGGAGALILLRSAPQTGRLPTCTWFEGFTNEPHWWR
jgi:hypothetical protein